MSRRTRKGGSDMREDRPPIAAGVVCKCDEPDTKICPAHGSRRTVCHLCNRPVFSSAPGGVHYDCASAEQARADAVLETLLETSNG